MPSLERAGAWNLWDLRAMRPAATPVATAIGTRYGRLTRMGEETSGRGRQSVRGDDERLEVLRLLQAGEITAEEAAQLLDALDRSEAGARATDEFAAGWRGDRRGSGQLRLRVSSSATGKANVNLALPIGLVGAGVAVARRFAPEHVPDPAVLREALARGTRGKILDVDSDGERVEIWVE